RGSNAAIFLVSMRCSRKTEARCQKPRHFSIGDHLMSGIFRNLFNAAMLSSALVLMSAAPAMAGPATDFIKDTSTELSSLLKQKDSAARQQKFSAKLHETVDFRELAALA